MITDSDKRLLEIFAQVASIEGVSQKEKPVADYIKNFLTRLGLSVTEDNSSVKTGSNTGNIICSVGSEPEFLLMSHMDTARSTHGLNIIYESDRLVSDKTTVLGVDNRAGIASILYSIEKAVIEKITLRKFSIAFTTCEETTLEGSKNLEFPESINRAFIFDSYMSPGNFVNRSCGAASFNIKIFGKAAHSGIAPEKGVNAFSIMVEAFKEIKLGWIDDETNANIGIFNGGSGINVVPDKVEIVGEVRSGDNKKVERYIRDIDEKIQSAAKRSGGKALLEYLWDFKPYNIDSGELVSQELQNALTSVGLTPKECISWGGSDANSLNERGIKSVNIGIGAQNPHSNEEFILYKDLQKTHEIIWELIRIR